MLAAAAIAAALAAQGPTAPPRPPVHIQAEDVDLRLKEGRTVATGSPLVTVTREDVVLTCRRVVAEHDPRGKIRRATCEGDVKLTRGTQVITCESAVYEDADARLTCRGNPTYRDGPSEFTGEELTYDLDQDRVRLSRGKGRFVEQPGQALPLRARGRAP
jgi:lipopolysaccharide transport protein LptA